MWPYLRLPAAATAGVEQVTGVDGVHGHLVLLDDVDFPAYVHELFSRPIDLVDGIEVDGQTMLVHTNPAQAHWQNIGDTPVVTATVPDADDALWAWVHDGVTYLAIGSTELENYVAALAETQRITEADDFAAAVVSGGLEARLIPVPGFTQLAMDTSAVLANQDTIVVGPCAESLVGGYAIPPDEGNTGTTPRVPLRLTVARVSGTCADAGFFDDLRSSLVAQGSIESTMGDDPVWRGPRAIVKQEGDVIVQIDATTADELVAMAPFVEPFLTGT